MLKLVSIIQIWLFLKCDKKADLFILLHEYNHKDLIIVHYILNIILKVIACYEVNINIIK